MKIYEFTYLIHPDISNEDINSLQNKIESFIKEEKGSIIKTNPPVKKRLAYSIKKNKEAFLTDLTFSLEPEKLNNLNKKIKSEKKILRYLIFKKKILKKKLLVPYKRKVKPKVKPKVKVELKEIEKKLEEILGE
ncbi:MAG: 30S ribosomal protein S6 [Candidatus Nealsonbacteria bacterium]